MNRLKIKIILITAAMLTVICVAQSWGAVKIGMTLPAGQFRDLRGNSVRLPAATSGRITVILLWALGCSSCREDLPALDALYRKLKPRGVEVVGINIGQGKSDVEKFSREAGISYSLLLDPEKKSVALYDAAGIPRTIILDRNGTIRFKIIGSTPPELIRKYVTSLLDS
ncbi:thiol-disulfide oxidoreductase ResA [Geobacter sp. OR-1]|uniref:TlpA family protein disulfide reductase n=1 Tax=Geobacter sp. OR-1 TaxID=1266765 RepID=UPI000541E31D|nr:TlpA disulfide reductase family protein [Geobacter sp. OR-1]GAM07875.1 thiol-disulfide oxidoreductase ResA [Geobacter sp. OR-1]